MYYLKWAILKDYTHIYKNNKYLLLVTQHVHNGMDLHIHCHILDQRHTDNTWHVSIHSCEDQATSKYGHKLHGESPCVQQPIIRNQVSRKIRIKLWKGETLMQNNGYKLHHFTTIKILTRQF